MKKEIKAALFDLDGLVIVGRKRFFSERLADLGQDAGKIPLRVDAVAFAAGDERPEPGVVLCRGVVAGEKPILSANRHALQRALVRIGPQAQVVARVGAFLLDGGGLDDDEAGAERTGEVDEGRGLRGFIGGQGRRGGGRHKTNDGG